MSDLSSPTGQKNLCKTFSTFFGGVWVRDVPTSRTLHSRLPPLFLDFLSLIISVSTPLGGEGGFRDVPTSRTLHSRIPPLFLDFLSPISSVSTPFGRRGGVQGCPNLPYFAFPASASFSWLPQSFSPISLSRADVFPVVASLRRKRSDRKYVCASLAFAGYSPITPLALFRLRNI